jgi:hypothetical protein
MVHHRPSGPNGGWFTNFYKTTATDFCPKTKTFVFMGSWGKN